MDRANFVLSEYRSQAYENHPISIGFEQTISQPYIVAYMLEQLDIDKKFATVLEVGAGLYMPALYALSYVKK